MSDEVGQAPKDVDIDELDIRIFMLVKDTSGMNSAVSFLNRRGWETVCQNNIAKSIDTIVNSQPEVVMVSVNHPNPNVMRLPTLLSQSMNAITIGFSETGDSMSIQKLSNSRFQHKFSGYPSGPSFHRFIRQILDRVHNPHKYEDKTRKRRKAVAANKKDSIEVKGSASSADDNQTFSNDKKTGPITVKGSAASQIRAAESRDPLIQKSATGPGSKKSAAQDLAEAAAKGGKIQAGEARGPSHSGMSAAEQARAQESASKTSFSAKTSGPKAASRSSATQEGNKAGPASRSQNSSSASSSTNSFDEYDEQGFKKKKRPQRKMYPWQKDEKPQEDAIKNQDTRPGASFEMKQSRKDLQKGSEEKEKQRLQKDEKSLGLQKGDKKKDGPDLTQEAAKGKGGEFSQEGPNSKKPNQANAEGLSSKEKGAQQGANEDGFNKKAQAENQLGADAKSKKDANEGDFASGKSHPSRGLRESDSKKSKEQTSENEKAAQKKKLKEASLDGVPKGELKESEDKFRSLMKEALKAATSEADPDVKIEIEDVEKIGVIPINTSILSGYVVISRSGIGFELGSDLLDTLLMSIESTFSAQGIDVTCQNPFIMDTEKFTFDFWKDNVGLFTIFEQSQREEIALTFLQTSESVPEMKVSKADPNMVTIQVNDIDIDMPVDFKTYIYLEKNQKFYKYLNDGRNILPRQKDKLAANKKTRELHIARDDFKRYQQYLARNLIKSLLQQAFKNFDAA
ncbi:MAG: hypothetical protein HRT45_00565 [Bdellovibrionales bacterium]|nr:hypothetical protein [Bdellovibrionales bacterium]